jgi:type IV pilus assembly protein PilW
VTTKDNFVSVPGTFVTDDLAYRYRDPTYLRRGSIDNSISTLTLTTGDTFEIPIKIGQVFMVACVGSSEKYVMVRASAAVAATANSVAVAVYGTPFPIASDGCMLSSSSTTPFVMLVHESRVRVVPLGSNNRPFLVVSHNLLNLTDFDVLAADVENFQVSYVMNQPNPNISPAPAIVDSTAANPNWVFGDEPGAPAPDLPQPSVTGPAYDDRYALANRFNASPANIRAVRIGLTIRSSRAMPNKTYGFPAQSIGNYTSVSTNDAFYRLTLSTQLRTPNLASRGLMTPSLANAADPADRRNKWGG